MIQKYTSINSNTTSNFINDRGSVVSTKNEPLRNNVNQAVSPPSGFTIPEHHSPQKISELIKQSSRFNDSLMKKNLKSSYNPKEPRMRSIYDKIEYFKE